MRLYFVPKRANLPLSRSKDGGLRLNTLKDYKEL